LIELTKLTLGIGGIVVSLIGIEVRFKELTLGIGGIVVSLIGIEVRLTELNLGIGGIGISLIGIEVKFTELTLGIGGIVVSLIGIEIVEPYKQLPIEKTISVLIMNSFFIKFIFFIGLNNCVFFDYFCNQKYIALIYIPKIILVHTSYSQFTTN